MTQGRIRLLALMIALAPAAASAAPPSEDDVARFEALDANRDGVFDLREHHAETTRRLGEIDRDGNGRFDGADYLALLDRRYSDLPPGAMKGLVPIGMRAMDGNRDGTVTTAEFAAHTRASFDLCDADRDGRMTLQELHVCSSPELLKR